MVKWCNLIQNENLKIYSRNSVRFMIFFVILTVIIGFIISYTQTNNSNNWKELLVKENKELSQNIKETSGLSINSELIKKREINEYHLTHNINPNEINVWSFIQNMSGVISIIIFFTVIVGGGMVANEFNNATIKLLLIRPVYRIEMLISKYISLIMFGFLLILILFVSSFIVGALSFGFNDTTLITHHDEQIVEKKMWVAVTVEYILRSMNIIVMGALSLSISSIFISNSLSIGISLLVMMGGTIIMPIISQYEWSKFTLFAHTDLMQHYTNSLLSENISLPFSILVLLIYLLLFFLLSILFLQKRDMINYS